MAFPGAEEAAIRERSGMSATRHHQLLDALVGHPEAVGRAPLLVRRLGRMRAARQRQRSADVLGRAATRD